MNARFKSTLLRRSTVISAAVAVVLTPLTSLSQATAAPSGTPRPAQADAAAVGEITTFADKCLMVANRDPSDGARIVQYRCEGDPTQHFTLVPIGGGIFEIKTFADKCLTVANRDPGNGAAIVQSRCQGDRIQRFTLVPVDAGKYEIKTFADKCLTVANRDPSNGAVIVQSRCQGDPIQRFTLG
ncbi:RICIN domain-containing protein [Embleya sp. NPDC059259]|uniref:RICIN domain-containing protein n=1 Tax=unclassified Embleya TaxID=2699296 RepID=UPI0036978048